MTHYSAVERAFSELRRKRKLLCEDVRNPLLQVWYDTPENERKDFTKEVAARGFALTTGSPHWTAHELYPFLTMFYDRHEYLLFFDGGIFLTFNPDSSNPFRLIPWEVAEELLKQVT